MALENKIQELLAGIRETNEYRVLRNQKAIVENNPVLRKKLTSYRARQLHLMDENLTDAERDNLFHDLEQEYKTLEAIPEINQFFKAFKNFNEMMDRASQRIAETLERETGIT